MTVLGILLEHTLSPPGIDLFHAQVTDINLCGKMCFSAAMSVENVKPCIVIVLGILLEHTLSPPGIDLFHAQVTDINLCGKMCYSAAAAVENVKPCIVIVLGILLEHTLSPPGIDLFHAQVTDINLCGKMCFSAAVIDVSVILLEHTLRPGALTYISCSNDLDVNIQSKVFYLQLRVAKIVSMIKNYQDKPMAPRGRATQQSRDTRKTTKQSDQRSLPHQDY